MICPLCGLEVGTWEDSSFHDCKELTNARSHRLPQRDQIHRHGTGLPVVDQEVSVRVLLPSGEYPMCKPFTRNLTRNAIESSEPTDYELECELSGVIPSDEDVYDAFSDDEPEPDICPTNGIGCQGCHNCR